MQRYKEAETAFLSALKERKGYKAFVQPHAMHQNLAEIYFITGQAVKSIDHLLWLGRYHRNSYEVQRDLGLAYLKIGRPDWALVKFRQALLTAPGSQNLWKSFNGQLNLQRRHRLPLKALSFRCGLIRKWRIMIWV